MTKTYDVEIQTTRTYEVTAIDKQSAIVKVEAYAKGVHKSPNVHPVASLEELRISEYKNVIVDGEEL